MLARRRAFLDTSFIIALTNVHDPFHAKALELDKQLADDRVSLTLHVGILIEIGDGFAKLQRRARGVSILEGMLGDESYEVAETTDQHVTQAIDLYRQRRDKEWGLTDCISFCPMQRLAITDALTADVHFQQAGFRALLLEV